MSQQELASPISAASGFTTRIVQSAILVFGVVAPILLVAFAFTSGLDAIERARIVIGGLERLVMILVATGLLGALYDIGFATGVRIARPHSDDLPETMAA